MNRRLSFQLAAAVLGLGAATFLVGAMARPIASRPMKTKAGGDVPLEISQIHWEYNSSANDLGVQVSLDGEDWKKVKIIDPDGRTLFDVRGKGPFRQLGLTELFFEGAEPSLDEFPLDELLDLFPEGTYEFEGRTVDDDEIEGEWEFTHAIPDGPHVSVTMGANNLLRISWTPVTAPPPGFPNEPIVITGYQVIVGELFQVTLPGSATSVTVAPEYVASLAPGPHGFEVLAIERSANQTITAGSFVK